MEPGAPCAEFRESRAAAIIPGRDSRTSRWGLRPTIPHDGEGRIESLGEVSA
jgi:hypothetical protein